MQSEKLAIFGTKKEAQYLYQWIRKSMLGEVIVFVDNDLNKQGMYIDGIPVVSFIKLQQMYGDCIDTVIIAAKGTCSRWEIFRQLKDNDISNIGLFKFSYSDYKKKINNLSDSVIWIENIEKPVITYLEYNVTDSCNLKCKGCSHFSNLFNNDAMSDYNQFSKDLKQISKNAYIAHLRLLGGEPLLHPDLYMFMDKAREILPYADINVVTNGLLISNQGSDLFETMRKNNVGFHITRYRPTDQQMSRICFILNQENIDYCVENECVEEFSKILEMKGKSDGRVSQEICQNKQCMFLRNRRLYKCPIEGMIEYFAERYGYQDIPLIRGVDIYDDKLNWAEILEEYYTNPVDMCKFCSEKGETFTWKVQVQPQKEDWIVGK